MTRYLETLLAQSFGLPADDPKVKKAVAELYRCKVVDPETADRLERRRKIFELHADPRNPVSVPDLAARFGLTRNTVHKYIAAELKSRRAS